MASAGFPSATRTNPRYQSARGSSGVTASVACSSRAASSHRRAWNRIQARLLLESSGSSSRARFAHSTASAARPELYDPSAGTFNSTGDMTSRRVSQSATLLPDGMVLIAGGETDSCAGAVCVFAGTVASAELYDPAAGAFAPTGNMTTPREMHTATRLPDGRVLITGGVYYGVIGVFYGSLASAELYSP